MAGVASVAKKAFDDLTTEEATELAKSCVHGANTEYEIRRCLTKAGFSGGGATITPKGFGPIFKVMVRGPKLDRDVIEFTTVRSKR